MYSSEVQQPSQPIPTCNTPRCGPTSYPAVSEGVAPSPSDAGQVAPLLVTAPGAYSPGDDRAGFDRSGCMSRRFDSAARLPHRHDDPRPARQGPRRARADRGASGSARRPGVSPMGQDEASMKYPSSSTTTCTVPELPLYTAIPVSSAVATRLGTVSRGLKFRFEASGRVSNLG